jgi:hypothetical protein
LFVDRFLRPRAQRRLEEFPSLGTIVVKVALMASTSHQRRMRDLVDLGFQPDVSGIALLDWTSFRAVVEIGFRHAQERLEAEAPSLAPEWFTGRVAVDAARPEPT